MYNPILAHLSHVQVMTGNRYEMIVNLFVVCCFSGCRMATAILEPEKD